MKPQNSIDNLTSTLVGIGDHLNMEGGICGGAVGGPIQPIYIFQFSHKYRMKSVVSTKQMIVMMIYNETLITVSL